MHLRITPFEPQGMIQTWRRREKEETKEKDDTKEKQEETKEDTKEETKEETKEKEDATGGRPILRGNNIGECYRGVHFLHFLKFKYNEPLTTPPFPFYYLAKWKEEDTNMKEKEEMKK